MPSLRLLLRRVLYELSRTWRPPAPGARLHLGSARTWRPPAPGARPHLGPACLVMRNLLLEEKHEVGFYSSGSLVYLSLFSFIEA